MSIYNPRGKRSRDVYGEVWKNKDGEFVKKGVTQLFKSKKDKPVAVTMPQLGNPFARYGPRTRRAGEKGDAKNNSGSQAGVPQVGAGEGNEGDEIGREVYGSGKEGSDTGGDAIYGEVSKPEIIKYLKDDLELDLLRPGRLMKFENYIYPVIAKHGPKSTFTLEETVKASFIRQTVWNEEDDFDPGDIEESDMRYRLAKPIFKEEREALVIFKRDISGSVSEEEMRMSYILTVLIEYWLEESYRDSVKSMYLPHNSAAWEDSKEGYYSLVSEGGTRFDAAYNLVLDMLKGRDYPRAERVVRRDVNADEVDIYLIDMSDGGDSNVTESISVLAELMPSLTRYCYVQTDFNGYQWRGKDHFKNSLAMAFQDEIRKGYVRIADVKQLEEVEKAMKIFFGRQRLK